MATLSLMRDKEMSFLFLYVTRMCQRHMQPFYSIFGKICEKFHFSLKD